MTKVDFEKYPDDEARTPRAVFTAKLRKICKQLDETSTQTLTHKHWYLEEMLTSTFAAQGLWVVGSYARGAPTCGDLDLVLDVKTLKGYKAKFGVVKKAFIGVHAGVRAYEGTPEDNTSRVKFEEAVQVWAPGMDWAAALEALPVDAQAGRFARPGDSVPLRGEQHGLSAERAQELAKLRDEGVLAWRFIPLSELSQFPRDASAWQDEHVYQWFAGTSASKGQMAPLVFALAKKLSVERGFLTRPRDFEYEEPFCLRSDGIHVFAGQLEFSPQSLSKLRCTAVAFVPPFSTRGPNGAWVIERGPNHPLERAYADAGAWVLMGKGGRPQHVGYRTTARQGAVFEATGIEFFASQEEAKAREDEWDDCTAPGAEVIRDEPRWVCGRQMLEILAAVDLVELGDLGLVALSEDGRRYCEVSEEPENRASALGFADRLKQLAARFEATV